MSGDPRPPRLLGRTWTWCWVLGLLAGGLGAQGCDSDSDTGAGGSSTTTGTGGDGGSTATGGGGDAGGGGGPGGQGGTAGGGGTGGAAPNYTDILYVAEADEVTAYVIGADGSVVPGPSVAEGSDRLVADAADRRLYGSHHYDTNLVRTFDVAEDGGLTHVKDTYLPSGITGMDLDRATDRLVVSHSTSSEVKAYPVLGDGTVGAGATAATAAGYPGWVVLHPGGSWALAPVVPTMGTNLVEVFAYDGSSGNVTSNGNGSTGDNHVRVAVPANKSWVHVSNGTDSSVTTFAFNATSGQLSAPTTVTTLPSGFTEFNLCTALAITPDDGTVYVINHGHDSVAAFSVGSSGGLTAIGHASTGSEPTTLAISPDGGYLYVLASGQSGYKQFGVYRIETGGTLTHLADVTLGSTAEDLLAVRLEPT